MYGQKQILSCLCIVVLVTILNFYKSVMKQNREQRAFVERHRRELVEKQTMAAAEALKKQQLHLEFKRKWLEYGDRCMDIHALIFKPTKHQRVGNEHNNAVDRSASSAMLPSVSASRNYNDDNENPTAACKKGINKKRLPLAPEEMMNIRLGDSDACLVKGCVVNGLAGGTKERQPPATTESVSGIIYVAVFILLVSLAKAAYDLSKQFKKLQQSKALSEDEVLRRCSLQEYSLIKHKQKQSSKALEPFIKHMYGLRPQLSLDSSEGQTLERQREFVRRISTNPQDYKNGSGLTSEPGTPVKAGKLLAGRPAPILRRCSVPVFVNRGSPLDGSRRPSMESVSEDDNSNTPDTKRRVRMIHRH